MAGQTDLLRHNKQLLSSAITFGYNPKRPISLAVEYEPEAERSQLELARIGYDQIAGFPVGENVKETLQMGGWSSEWNDRLDVGTKGVCHVWSFDSERQIRRDQHGYGVRLRPFMGIYGLAPAEPGVHSTIPPRRVGGNIDCKELIAGSTLYLSD